MVLSQQRAKIHIGHFVLFICSPSPINHLLKGTLWSETKVISELRILFLVLFKDEDDHYQLDDEDEDEDYDLRQAFTVGGQKVDISPGSAALHLSLNRRRGLQICSWPTLITSHLSHIQHIHPLMGKSPKRS